MGRPRNYVRKDDREYPETLTHCNLVVGVDRAMSGWGDAAKGLSVAAWACREEDAARVFKWVKARGDIKKVKLVTDRGRLEMYWPPKSAVHFHIYVVRPGHPALAGA